MSNQEINMTAKELHALLDQAIRSGYGDLPVMVDDDNTLFDVAKLDHSHTIPEGEDWDYPREFDKQVDPYLIIER